MFIYIRHKFLIAILVLLGMMTGFCGIGLSTPAIAGDVIPEVTEADQELLNYINQARENPLSMAEAVGLDKDVVLAAFPDKQEMLENGLPPLKLDERLHQAAASHAADMLSNNYYDHTSPEGKTHDQRITDAGYLAKAADESLGVLSFRNYIPSDIAAFQLFANIYRDALHPDRENPGNILDPDFKDAGVRVYAGAFEFNEFSGNVYLAVCDFAAPYQMALYERQMMQLVNQARNDAAAVADYYGLDLDAFLEVFPEYEYSLENGLPPLAFNERLYAAAVDHARDMLSREYMDAVSPDNTTPEMRAKQKGYDPVWIAESRYRLPTYDEKVSPGKTVGRFFQKIFTRAVKPGGEAQYKHLFSDQPGEAGVRLLAGKSPMLGGIVGSYVQLAVMEYGGGVDTEAPILIGAVYRDKNNNQLYDPGEGVSNTRLTVKNKNAGPADENYLLKTDGAGGFSQELAPGAYRVLVSLAEGEESVSRGVEMDTKNRWLAIRLAPASD
ncbi:MAG: CAP domain-containing protein [Desulfobacterales bacterium]